MKKLRWKQIAMYLPMVFLMAIIFAFSSQPADESSAESSRIVNLVLHSLEFIRRMKFSSKEFIYWAEKIHTPIRKIAHMTEYALLAWTIFIPTLIWNWEKLWKTLIEKRNVIERGLLDKKRLGKICFGSILATMLYAATDEFHQLFVEGRSGEITDVFIDTCGAILGILGLLLLWRIQIWIVERANKKRIGSCRTK